MNKILKFAVLVCVLSVASASRGAFFDDFNRANGNVGNGWSVVTTGTVTSQIVDNEALVAGTAPPNWVRSGISRPIAGDKRVSCDFKNDDAFGFHIQVRPPNSNAYVEAYCWSGGPLEYANSLDGNWPSAGWQAFTGNANTVPGQYNNVVLEVEGSVVTVSLNGKVCGTVTNSSFSGRFGNLFISCDAESGTVGSMHIDNVLVGVFIAGAAKDPRPAPGTADMPREVVLGWTPGQFAATHNVFFGATFDDVNNATVAKPLGTEVSPGQADAAFDPTTLLEFGKTYYWRVDEVNAPAKPATFKGEVWNFTVEPYTYPITSIVATASSSEKTTNPPQNTVNGSGLANDLHSTVTTAMWLSSMTGPQPAWIQYEFDRAYSLDEMWVWNYDVEFEPVLGYGFKDVTIEYSLDGTTWTALPDVQFAQATAQNGYAHNTTVDFGGVMAKYVRLTAKTNWSPVGLKQYGLSEVRFFQIPVVAREPNPMDGATGVPLDATLTWRLGREAVSHKVYFGSDKKAVTEGTATGASVTEDSFEPGGMEYGKIYYWRVDEVNEAAATPVREGDVWKFTSTEFFVVDDFEAYNDDDNRIFDAWVDGFATKASGSTVGNLDAPFAERTVVHEGSQAMPMDYDNTAAPFYSEAERTFDAPQNWAVPGVTDLVVWLRGNAATLVETAPGQYAISANTADVWGTIDNFRFVYKKLNGDGAIVAKVVNITGGSATWAKAGVMIRESLDPSSAYAFMFPTPDGRRAFQGRSSTGINAVSVHSNPAAVTFPVWVKVERKGSQFTASYSQDGKTWTVQPTNETVDGGANPLVIGMTGAVYIGMAVASNNTAGGFCSGGFSDVVATGGVSGDWTVANVGPNPGNSPDGMYVVVKDSAGKSAMVAYPDNTGVLKTEWTEWRIPLSSLTGVNLSKVQKLSIGVGDRSSPKAAGTGRIYIDDIRVGTVAERVVENLLANGGFEDGVLEPWTVYGSTGEVVATGAYEGSFCLKATVGTKPANFYSSGVKYPNQRFQKGKKYTVSAWLRCEQGTRKIAFKPEMDGEPYTGYGNQEFTMTTEWAQYSTTTPEFTQDVNPADITFHIGYDVGSFYMDDVRFYEGDYFPSK